MKAFTFSPDKWAELLAETVDQGSYAVVLAEVNHESGKHYNRNSC